jgi:adenine-specific DNA-methyltransferase
VSKFVQPYTQHPIDLLEGENPLYLERELITYIGNKRGLIPFIAKGVELVKQKLGKQKLSFLDLFAGSGVVSRFMKQHSDLIVANDIEDYTSIVNACYLANQSRIDWVQAREQLTWLEHTIETDWRRGFIAELYAPLDDHNIQPGERVFYTRRNAEYIDTARQHIERLPPDFRFLFLAPLIVAASIHNNTGGVFKGFYKNRRGIGAFGGEAANALTRILGAIQLRLPVLSEFECQVEIRQSDARELCRQLQAEFDLVYLDPPYNQHPYGSNYFMLNLIARYERPGSLSNVSGIPTGWARSPFNKPQSARDALFSVIEHTPARYFLISYNSEGFIQKGDFIAFLKQRGTLTMLETRYNTYRASRNLMNRDPYVTEYLFLLERN